MIPAAALSRMKILVVDDEPANVSLLRYILQAAGYDEVRTTTDARQAMPLFREFQPDLILLDLMMPHISGFEVMGRLEAEITPGDCLPILVLTADVTDATKHKALQAGASDFLTKPFDQIEVLLRIRHLLQIRNQHLQLTRQNTSLEDAVQARTCELTLALVQLEETVRQLRDTQQQVIQHERMSALGSMAAGLAHDFNNSLSLILGYSELLMTDLSETPYSTRSDEYLGTVMTAAQDAAKMFNRLRGFYRTVDHEQEFRSVDLNALVEQAVALTRPRWHGQALGDGLTIDVRTRLGVDLPPLLADAAELREMLTNLIFNAVDALPRGGAITLRTRVESPAEVLEASREKVAGTDCAEDCTCQNSPSEGTFGLGAMVLEVADTGTGMDEETCRRCLEPFFTTKGKQGTGLGLAMVYGTMQRHGGNIELQSTPGRGTTFILRLPLQNTAADAAPAPASPENHRPRRILVVDDQPVFVNILRQYLTTDCHAVETALDGREALEKFRVRAGGEEPFDLVITDKAMPHLRGERLAAEVKALAPQTRVILLTGMSIPGKEETVDASAVDLTLLKPVTHAVLRASISRVMADYLPAVLKASGDKGDRAQPPAKASGYSVLKRPTGPGPVRRSGRPPKVPGVRA